MITCVLVSGGVPIISRPYSAMEHNTQITLTNANALVDKHFKGL